MTTVGCEEARERLAAWLSGEIEPDERGALDMHLRSCAACAADADRARRALDVVASEEVPDPGPLYWSSFGVRLRARIAAARRRTLRRRLTAAIAAAAVVVAGLAVLQRRHEAPSAGAGPVAEKRPDVPDNVPAPLPAAKDAAGTATDRARRLPGQGSPARRALPVAEAEVRLREALDRAVAQGHDPGEIEALLEEIAPADPLDGADLAGHLSPEEGRRLADELLEPRG